MIAAMHRDFDALGIERPDHEPRATDYVPQMLSLIGQLEGKGLAYQAGNGDVNYAVRKFPGYGKLSGKSLDELQAGERVAVRRARTTRWTSCCGSPPSRGRARRAPSGTAPLARAGPAGTSNARP
jgi:cysteinyl-tRNA synthetase